MKTQADNQTFREINLPSISYIGMAFAVGRLPDAQRFREPADSKCHAIPLSELVSTKCPKPALLSYADRSFCPKPCIDPMKRDYYRICV
jgi:hypothetical protein